jgi:hypothetical protein
MVRLVRASERTYRDTGVLTTGDSNNLGLTVGRAGSGLSMGHALDGDPRRAFHCRQAPRNEAPSKNSLLPSGPVIGLSTTPATVQPGNPHHHAATRSHTA